MLPKFCQSTRCIAVLTKSSIQIQAVTTREESKMFLDAPSQVYANDPHWVAPIRSSIVKQFTPTNPFFNYGKLQQFIIVSQERGAKPLGRIVAAVNQHLIEKEGQNVGLFGYFECVQDFEVAQSLLNTASEWLQQQGMTVVRGPIDLSTHNKCFFLVDGFDSPPTVMMPYNPRYYPEFIERDGWHKAKDAYAYDFLLDKPSLPTKFEKAYRIACKSGVNFRPVRTKGEEFETDAITIYHLFNRAFANNWSSTPRSEAEFMEEAKDLRKMVCNLR